MVIDFPFRTEEDAAVWLVALLSAIARPAFNGPVPETVLIGNRAGTRKGLLIDLIGILAQGQNVPTRVYSRDLEETRKEILAFAMDCCSMIHYENLVGGNPYGSSALDQAITTSIAAGRVLQRSKNVQVPLRLSWFVEKAKHVSAERPFYQLDADIADQCVEFAGKVIDKHLNRSKR